MWLISYPTLESIWWKTFWKILIVSYIEIIDGFWGRNLLWYSRGRKEFWEVIESPCHSVEVVDSCIIQGKIVFILSDFMQLLKVN